MRGLTHSQSDTQPLAVMSHDNAQFDSILPDSLKCQPQVSVQVCRRMCMSESEDVWGCRATISWMSAIKTTHRGIPLPPCLTASRCIGLESREFEKHWMVGVHHNKQQNTEEAPVPKNALEALCWISGSWACLLSNFRWHTLINYNSQQDGMAS